MIPSQFKMENDIRQQQINTLKIFNANVTEIEDNKEYNISFQSGNRNFKLRVILSPEFPKKCPEIVITPAVQHPWVSTDGRITEAPGVLNYTMHSDLGRIVQAIVREFERNPLVIDNGYSNEILERGKCTSPIGATFSLSCYSSSPVSYQTSFPELEKLSLEELEMLNENIDKIDELIEENNYLKSDLSQLDSAVASVENLAKENIAMKEAYDNLKKELLSKIEEINEHRSTCEALNQNYMEMSTKFSPTNIKSLLHDEVGKIDEESDAVAEQFLSGDINLESFLNVYLCKRKLFHERKTKEDKLAHQLKELEKAGY